MKKKDIDRVVAAKFHWACECRRNKILLTFIKINKKGKVLVRHKLVDRTGSYRLIIDAFLKNGYTCASVIEFNKAENAVLFTTCRMERIESMLNKAVKTAIGIIEKKKTPEN